MLFCVRVEEGAVENFGIPSWAHYEKGIVTCRLIRGSHLMYSETTTLSAANVQRLSIIAACSQRLALSSPDMPA